ncbi:Diaphanous [Apophysomyces ossiformis]|uniref:Diaphanous n=1 Tax=Apophysomyces ossiformis TaxID=679940 RepID=A0A8H7BKN2_9FUNG|nr:Diaphanous [Apophysomyces ossiformis]
MVELFERLSRRPATTLPKKSRSRSRFSPELFSSNKGLSFETFNPSFLSRLSSTNDKGDKVLLDDDELDELFQELLERRGLLDENIKEEMMSWDASKKWLMIDQDRQVEHLTRRSSSILLMENSNELRSVKKSDMELALSDQTAPEYFIRALMQSGLRAVTPSITSNLQVSLRARPVDWVEKFIGLKGLHVLINSLAHINSQKDSRKLACELLIFLCHCEGHVYDHILEGFESLRSARDNLCIFDTWLKELGQLIEKDMLVQSFDAKNAKVTLANTSPLPGNFVKEYSLSNILLINALTNVPKDIHARVHIRQQFNASGIKRILRKLEKINYRFIDTQVDIYRISEQNDLNDILGDEETRYNQIVLDRRGYRNNFGELYGVTVGSLIQKFSDLDRLHKMETEASINREQLLKALAEKKRMEHELHQLLKKIQHSTTLQAKPLAQVPPPPYSSAHLQLSGRGNGSGTLSSCKNDINNATPSLSPCPSLAAVSPPSPASPPSPPPPPPPPPPAPPPPPSLMAKVAASSTDCISGPNIIPPVPKALTRKELRYYPEMKLKVLQWQKLNQGETENTVWCSPDTNDSQIEQVLYDAGVFEELQTTFPVAVNPTLPKQKSESKDIQSTITFLSKEKRRDIHIGILPRIKRYKSFQQVRASLLRFDRDLCNETFLHNLVAALPRQGKDLEAMRQYMNKSSKSDLTAFDVPEQFLLTMMSVYRYQERLHFMLFRVQFWERYDSLKTNMSTIIEVSNALIKSVSFRSLLHLLLLIGNYMNASSFQGGAYGIRIGSLNRIADVKASKQPSLTFMQVIVSIVRRHFPHLLMFLDDLQGAGKAAHIMASIGDIVQQYTEIRENMKKLDNELEMKWRSVKLEEGDLFLQIMEEYQAAATTKYKEIESLYIQMNEAWRSCMIFYAEDPKTKNAEEFFNIFAEFMVNWKQAAIAQDVRDLKALQEKKEKAEMMRKHANAEIIQEPIIDDLLNELKMDERLYRVRQRRERKRETTSCLFSSLEELSAENLLKLLQAE